MGHPIYEVNELDEISTCRKFRQVRQEGKRMVNRTITMYNLDMIISVGYRVNTKRGIKFRQWANRVLKDYWRKIDNLP
ncbi:MAG: virulence RhuM family protein [Prevotella sp.]|nr:virulence RhuM family protein [Prevotella sp.]